MAASMVEQLRMLRDWAPLLVYGRQYAAASSANERSLVVADAVEWMASRTPTTLDDRLAGHLKAILQTPQGEALVRDLVAIVDSLPKEPQP